MIAIETAACSVALVFLKWNLTDEQDGWDGGASLSDETTMALHHLSLTRQEQTEMEEQIAFYDWLSGGLFIVSWVLGHVVILLLLSSGLGRASWRESYEANMEPYAPVQECTTCGLAKA